jgi:phage terminase large subunit-like protein
LSSEQKAALAWRWRGWQARPNQVEPEGEWRYWLVMAGRGFGKTRVGAEWVREKVRHHKRVALLGKDAGDMRAVMIEGESGILAVCPRHERPEYQASKRVLKWPNGAISEFRTGEDPEGVRGLQCEALWADELAAWQYPAETWDMAMLGLRLGPDPRACITTTPKPIRLIRDLVRDEHCVVTHGTTYDNLSNLAPAFASAIIRRYEGTRLGRQELDAELLEDEGLAYRFSEHAHVIHGAWEPPASFERFESCDYGSNNPTAWLAWCVDYDGNLVVYDEFYEPGLPSEIAPRILALRKWWRSSVCWADPSLWIGKGITNKFGREANSADEFHDSGVSIVRANNDRRAGYLRLSELLRMEEARRYPSWHHRAGESPAPRMFVSDRCTNLIEQLRDAPLETSEPGPTSGPHPLEAVAVKWEGAHGHAHAACRYGAMSRPGASSEPEDTFENDPVAAERWLRAEALKKRERLIEAQDGRPAYTI